MGAVPPTCSCLKSLRVHLEVEDAGSMDEIQMITWEMPYSNTIAWNLLRVQGSNGNMLMAYVKKKQNMENVGVTVQN